MFVGAKAGDAAAGLFRGLNGDQEASLERVALAALAAGKRRTAGDVRPQAARNAAPDQALGGLGIGAFEVPAFVPHPLGGRVEWRRDRFRPMASCVSALSSIVANGHQVLPTFPPPPLFIPYGEFSPVRLDASLVAPRPSAAVPGCV